MPRLPRAIGTRWLRGLGRRGTPRSPGLGAETVITLRLLDESDHGGSVARLAELSGGDLPSGRSLVAEVDGEPRAAIALGGGSLLIDPFHPTDELGSLLALRRDQLQGRGAPGDRRSAA